MQCNEIFPESLGDAAGSDENFQCVVDAKGCDDHIESLGDGSLSVSLINAGSSSKFFGNLGENFQSVENVEGIYDNVGFPGDGLHSGSDGESRYLFFYC